MKKNTPINKAPLTRGNPASRMIDIDLPNAQGGESLKQVQANLQTILNNADSGYALYNADLRIVSFNALAQKLSIQLYSKKLVEGKHLLYYFPEDRHQVLTDITRRVLNGEEINYEMHFDSLADGERWIDVKWVHVADRENENRGFILISKDITQKKLTAIEHEKVALELMQRNKALEQFAYITAHNLRGPIGNIINLAEGMSELNSEQEEKEYLDFILLSAKNLIKVVEDINHILKIKIKPQEIKDKIELQTLVNDIKTTISNWLVKEQATIICNFKSVPYIFGFRSYLYSIFYNLISNGVKYRKNDVPPEICISAKIIGSKIQIMFKDNGKGIDLDKNGANLFGLYNRFDYSVEGRGMGLFMVKYQVETLGGSINVQSALGEGTTFIVEFPLTN